MKHPDQTLRVMRLTEKASGLTANLNQYTFEVADDATKHDVADAVARAFNVTVRRVNVINTTPRRVRGLRGRPGRRPGFKKAIVTLAEGDKIELT